MKYDIACTTILTLFLGACSRTETAHPPASGSIASDSGGMQGYQHGMDKSKFAMGADRRETNEFGFLKVVGSEGTFAVDAHNGLAVGIPNANSAKATAAQWYTHDFVQHNQLVMDYFAGAGIPKDQVAGVHATTSMSASARGDQLPRPQPGVGGYQSILDRKLGDLPVVDSIAWARMNDAGEVLAEWVYWPAIPAKAVSDARRMSEMMLNSAERTAYLAKLPPDLPPGTVVVRHSSATSAGEFEAFASYDVSERRLSPEDVAAQRPARRSIVIVRHFDLNGEERKLPQERAQFTSDYPTANRPAPAARGK